MTNEMKKKLHRILFAIRHSSFVILNCIGCGLINNVSNGGFNNQKNPDVYHVGEHRWVGDTILVHLYKTSEPTLAMTSAIVQVECRSCNVVTKPFDVGFDNAGNGHIYIPEAHALL